MDDMDDTASMEAGDEINFVKSKTTGHADLILSLPVSVQVVLGSTQMSVANLMKLGRGDVVSLDQKVGESVDIVVSGQLVARGEIVVLDEDGSRYGVCLTEVTGSHGGAAEAR